MVSVEIPAVTAVLQGGLGNQMFQYAAAHAVSGRTGARIELDLGQLGADSKRPFVLGCYGISQAGHDSAGIIKSLFGMMPNIMTRTLAKTKRALSSPSVKTRQVYRQPGFHYDEAFEDLAATVRLEGYFQSELFFADDADDVRQLFQIRIPVSSSFGSAQQQIRRAEWPVSIHVRRQDYVNEPHTMAYHGICDVPYYRRALSLVSALCDRAPTYFVFSDDQAAARAMFADANAVFVEGDTDKPWEDMALMAGCRGHILANSSFSWWGAWLDGHPDKWVIAPRQWFSRQQLRKISTADIFCDGWITL